MPIPTFPPSKEADLLQWTNDFSSLLSTLHTDVGITLPQVTTYADLSNAFANAYAVAKNPNTNSKANTAAKNNAKQAMLHGPGGAWELVNIIQAYPGTTNDHRAQLGLRIPDHEMTPIGPPKYAPTLILRSTKGRWINIRLEDVEAPDTRGKPKGVQGATVLYYIGEDMPTEFSQWVFSQNTSRTQVDVEIPGSVPAGAKVWLTALWFNNRKQSSPAALPQFTRVSDGVSYKKAA
jgi:hypothetical protein